MKNKNNWCKDWKTLLCTDLTNSLSSSWVRLQFWTSWCPWPPPVLTWLIVSSLQDTGNNCEMAPHLEQITLWILVWWQLIPLCWLWLWLSLRWHFISFPIAAFLSASESPPLPIVGITKPDSWPDKAQFAQDVRLLQPRARLIDPQCPVQYGIDPPTMPDLHSRQCSVPDRTMCWGSTSGVLPPMANGVPGQTSPRKLGILYMQEYWKC